MIDPFYRAFEEKHRGSRASITERLHVYSPFIRGVIQTYAEGQAIDLGCGRGEWLELLINEGFTPTGVDLDEGMLDACQQLGLPAVKADALALLSQTESNSQLVISAFHVVEHISFEQLRTLVAQALRVLKPGGLLILETPNPENLAVATRHFYLDPTHQRPIPPALLEFVVEFAGFERVKTLRLQEEKDIAVREKIGLVEVLNCVSPDYAVIAQKKADAPLLMQSQELFDADYGVSLDVLSAKLDQRLTRIEEQSVQGLLIAQQAETKAQQAETKAQQAETKAQQAETKAQQAETKAQQAEAKAKQIEINSNQLRIKLNRVYASKSWRLTAPLRWVLGQIKQLQREGLLARLKAFVEKALRKISHELQKRPKLRQIFVICSRRLGWDVFLKRVNAKVHGQQVTSNSFVKTQLPVAMNFEKLPPRARQIYDELKQAIEQKKRGNT